MPNASPHYFHASTRPAETTRILSAPDYIKRTKSIKPVWDSWPGCCFSFGKFGNCWVKHLHSLGASRTACPLLLVIGMRLRHRCAILPRVARPVLHAGRRVVAHGLAAAHLVGEIPGHGHHLPLCR